MPGLRPLDLRYELQSYSTDLQAHIGRADYLTANRSSTRSGASREAPCAS
jgi:hypothetical protein